MQEFLSKFDAGQLISLIAVVGGLLLAMIAVIVNGWRRVRIAEMEMSLKRQMLEKGIPQAQIDQVMKANRETANAAPVISTGNEIADKAALIQRMVDNGYEGEDIERVLKAYHPAAKPTTGNPA